MGHTILWIYLTTLYHVYLKLKMLYFILCVKVSVAQSCLTLCDPMDWGLPGSSVHGILQKTILEWVAIPFSRVASWPRDWTQISCIAGKFFTLWATREAPCYVCAVHSRSVMSDSLRSMDCSVPGSSVHGDSPGRNTGVGCHALLQGTVAQLI